MIDLPDWLGTILTGAGSALLTWWFGRKKENADLQTQATTAWKELSEKMETREKQLQTDLDQLRTEFNALKVEMGLMKLENAKLRQRLSVYERDVHDQLNQSTSLP